MSSPVIGRSIPISAAIKRNPFRRKFEEVQLKIKFVPPTSHGRRCIFLCGISGIGKTAAIINGLSRNGQSYMLVNPRNSGGLYRAFFLHRNKSYLIIDDTEHIAKSEPCANLVKQALAPPFRVHHHSKLKTDEDDDEEIPQDCKVRFNLVWLSNVDYKERKNISGKMAPHFAALVSRGLEPVWIDGTDDEIFQYTCWLATHGGMLKKEGLGRRDGEYVISWWIRNRDRLKDLTPRALSRVGQEIRATKVYGNEDPAIVAEKRKARKMFLDGFLLSEPRKEPLQELKLPRLVKTDQGILWTE
jgi:hypothetical protein